MDKSLAKREAAASGRPRPSRAVRATLVGRHTARPISPLSLTRSPARLKQCARPPSPTLTKDSASRNLLRDRELSLIPARPLTLTGGGAPAGPRSGYLRAVRLRYRVDFRPALPMLERFPIPIPIPNK
eukprot:scaffold241832_cov29-Tisochrysis_lutea.AAC.3